MRKFPSDERVQRAIQKSLREGLGAAGGDWIATLGDDEIEFRPCEDGTIEADLCLDDDALEKLAEGEPAEKTYRFRVVVELVQVEVR